MTLGVCVCKWVPCLLSWKWERAASFPETWIIFEPTFNHNVEPITWANNFCSVLTLQKQNGPNKIISRNKRSQKSLLSVAAATGGLHGHIETHCSLMKTHWPNCQYIVYVWTIYLSLYLYATVCALCHTVQHNWFNIHEANIHHTTFISSVFCVRARLFTLFFFFGSSYFLIVDRNIIESLNLSTSLLLLSLPLSLPLFFLRG